MRSAIVISLLLAPFFFVQNSLAKTDLSITATDIAFSKDEPLAGEKIRVFARVFNLGDTDVYGFVIFLDSKKELADPQPISVKASTYDDVFIDWLVSAGTHNISAKIVGASLQDDNLENDTAVRESYFVDLDTDGDKVGNKYDDDDDNDGLSDEKEAAMGTNPLNADTDGDKAQDGIDPFPLDKSEWQDLDKDQIGDNKDNDDDNDGLSDDEESFVWGTNPLNQDTDSDGLLDKEEINLGTKATLKDTDGDGAIDSKDKFPLDSSKIQASLLEAVGNFAAAKKLSAGLILLPILLLVFFLYKKIRGKIT
ncbi:MAG: hypothetical protein HYV47_00025 [Candidatus Nealsonbacteria bacterium]|nr:hypothetical protein [Candidatus Nealsonbacteria bacterium]